ncbi:MAG: hypothetical protein RIT45_1159 [Pseudomonadota bacterium]
MTTPPSLGFKIEILDPQLADQTRKIVQVGRRFVFVGDGTARPTRGPMYQRVARAPGRNKRRKVLPLIDDPVELDGLRVLPAALDVEPIAALVTDRDLYRAEQDTVHLFVAMPAPPPDLRLVVDFAGKPFTERSLDPSELESLREHGVHVEPLAMLLPGDYKAQLQVGARRIGSAANFTVADYALAPLSGRLVTHVLHREQDELSFALDVESFEQPFTGQVSVELLSGADVVDQTVLSPLAPGRYAGAMCVSGEGTLRLRLIAVADAERSCEVVIPGSRKRERDTTPVSKLGRERTLALMPEPGALPLRGAYISEGDFLFTPVVVEDVVGEVSRLEVRVDIEALATISVDLTTGATQVEQHGDVAKGATIELRPGGVASSIFVGGWVKGRAFEGFTHLFHPGELALGVDARHIAEAGLLSVELRCNEKGPRPVLLCVRDERLTATNVPDVALSASMKRTIVATMNGLGGDWALANLSRGELWTCLKAGVASIDLDRRRPTTRLLARVSAETAELLSFVPVDEHGDTVTVATAYPDEWKSRRWLEQIFARAGQKVEVCYAPEGRIHAVIAARHREFKRDPARDEPYGVGRLDMSAAIGEDFESRSVVYRRSPHSNVVYSRRLSAYDDFDEDAGFGVDDFDEDAGFDGDDYADSHVRTAAGVGSDEPPSEPEEDHEPPRANFPEVIFYGLVEVDGAATIELPLADALGTFTVEAFALTGTDWARATETVVVDKPARAELVVPPAVHPDDKVRGIVRGAAASGDLRLALTCDGVPVPLHLPDGALLQAEDVLPSPVELTFPLGPGVWVAEVEDVTTGARDAIERVVDVPGELRSYAREIAYLQPGDRIALHDLGEDALSLRVLPSAFEPMQRLLHATAGYEHLCCEQTAAKILSAATLYLSARAAGFKKKAERIIRAGVEREREMFLPDRGFALYPGQEDVSLHWSEQTVQHLWGLHALAQVPGLPFRLRHAVHEALAMADDAGRVHGIERVPTVIASAEEAYVVASAQPARVREAANFVLELVDLTGVDVTVNEPGGAVLDRCVLSYTAATLLLAGEIAEGVRVANVVLRQLDSEGRLYSTVDSVAAIALFGALELAGVGKGDGEVIVNGNVMSLTQAAALSDQVETIEVVRGVCIVELSAIRTERWSDYESGFGVRVGFRSPAGRKVARFAQGDRVELRVELLEGYKSGDLLHVALPASLSWLKGGGKVQRFSVDFAGKTEVRVPLVVTGRIEGRQRFAVCVRNMFEQERASNPGLLQVKAK